MPVDQIVREIRYAARGLWRDRPFTLTTVSTLSVAIALRWMLPESPQFLARRPSPSTVPAPSVGSLFGAEFRRDTVALWAAFCSCLVSVYLGVAKVGLVPAALLCLVTAALRGERWITVLLGAVCLVGETLYTLGNPDQPLGWFVWLYPPHS